MALLCLVVSSGFAQDGAVLPGESKYKEPTTKMWFNTYGKIRVSKRLFWDAQTHFRFEETGGVNHIGQIAQFLHKLP